MKYLPLLFLLFVVATPLIAQVSQERQILVIPRAEHPQIAKDSGLGGRVTVFVTVDNVGNVVSVGNVSGPDSVCPSVARADVVALRESARAAAADAKFASGSGEPSMSIPLNFDYPSNKSEQVYAATNDHPAEYTGPVVAVARATETVAKGDALPSSRFGNPRSIQGGVLNGKAMSLPKPPYPPAARAVRASGAVTIQVLIDEEGQIFSAAPVSGHPLLRMAARQAACGAAFSPTTLSGQPVKVSGVITYNFVP